MVRMRQGGRGTCHPDSGTIACEAVIVVPTTTKDADAAVKPIIKKVKTRPNEISSVKISPNHWNVGLHETTDCCCRRLLSIEDQAGMLWVSCCWVQLWQVSVMLKRSFQLR